MSNGYPNEIGQGDETPHLPGRLKHFNAWRFSKDPNLKMQ